MTPLHPLITRRLERLGITTPQAIRAFLDPDHYTPASPYDLPDMPQAVERVRRAISQQQRILVWGDFDVDGQTSTALLVSALRQLGAVVDYHIPDRFSEGHGVHLPTLKTLLPHADLLLTCDTGVAAHDAIEYASSQGIDTVVTDHHSLPPTLPQAHAVINPMRLPHGHPLRELPGVGVAYQLIRALFEDRPSDHLLDLVAVGIVADVMVLVDDTRYWLQRGLAVLRDRPRPGLRAILERAEVDPATLTEMTIGFTVGPRLNALGRLANANPAVELLTTDDPAILVERANELEGLNQQRRFLTNAVYTAAKAQIDEDPALLKFAALVVSGAGWHTGVVGIVASKLVEEYERPVIVLSEHEGQLSGSGRSIAGCNLVEALRSQHELLTGYGGHTMAAGLRLPIEALPVFRRGLSQVVRHMLNVAEVPPVPPSDGVLRLDEITLELADALNVLAPFGNGNPPLRFVSEGLRITHRRQLGRTTDHLELSVQDADGHEQKVKWWSVGTQNVPDGTFDLTYTLRANVFRGTREVMMEWLSASRSAEDDSIAPKPRYQVVDYRTQPEMRAQVQKQFPEALLWREASDIGGVDRQQLAGSATLIVWTPPPSPTVWLAALDTVQPQTLILFNQPPPYDTPETLLPHLSGMLKFALKRDGLVPVERLAARTSHTPETIHAALRWIDAHTGLALNPLTPEVYQVSTRGAAPTTKHPALMARLQAHIENTRAYRRLWGRL